jgi:hypothetical protein
MPSLKVRGLVEKMAFLKLNNLTKCYTKVFMTVLEILLLIFKKYIFSLSLTLRTA